MEGRQIFADALTQFAEQHKISRLTPVVARAAAPLRVAVLGRDGVGADVHVLVIAEGLKPEDRALLAAAGRPTVTVLNKADLSGLGDGGPLPRAHRRAADCRAVTGVPTVPMVAVLATADLDDEMLRALRVLLAEPADLTSTDAFVD